MAVKTFTQAEKLTAADTNTYLNNGGLVYISTTTVGSAVATVTVSNCFSSTYDNYRIILYNVSISVGGSIGLGLNNSTGNTYQEGGYFLTFGTATLNAFAPAANVRWLNVWAAEGDQTTGALDLFAPNLAKKTTGTCNSIKSGAAGGATNAMYMFSFLDSSTAQNTGFTIYPTGGTLTGGTIVVYGYRKA